MNELNISAVDATAMETATTTSAPKHKWLSKGAKFAKKATMFATVAGVMATTCATQAFAAGTGGHLPVQLRHSQQAQARSIPRPLLLPPAPSSSPLSA